MSEEIKQWIKRKLEWHQEWKPTYGDTEIDIARNQAKIDILEEILHDFPRSTE
jgi:hypothetical protein